MNISKQKYIHKGKAYNSFIHQKVAHLDIMFNIYKILNLYEENCTITYHRCARNVQVHISPYKSNFIIIIIIYRLTISSQLKIGFQNFMCSSKVIKQHR